MEFYSNNIVQPTEKVELLEPEFYSKRDTTTQTDNVSKPTTDDVIESVLLGCLIGYCIWIIIQLLSNN